MIKISKELLSEVLDCSIDNYTIAKSTEITQIRVWEKDTDMWDYRSYDIHHLAHKCKEWARDKYDITISSSLYKNYAKSWDVSNDKSYTADTEVEAIIKACEWILDNKPL